MTDTRDLHSRAPDLDTEIARLYMMGESTMAISKRLGIRPALVISRVRGLRLAPPRLPDQPPADRIRDEEAGTPPIQDPPAHAAPQETQSLPGSPLMAEGTRRRSHPAERPRTRRNSSAALRPMEPTAEAEEDEDEDDSDDFPASPGRPRGWLITEREHFRLFARHGERFEDFLLRRRNR